MVPFLAPPPSKHDDCHGFFGEGRSSTNRALEIAALPMRPDTFPLLSLAIGSSSIFVPSHRSSFKISLHPGLNLGLMRKSASSTISRSRFPIFKTSFPRTPVQRRDAHWQFPSVNGRFTPQNAWDALAAMDYPEDVARNSQVLMRFFPIMDPDPVTPSGNAGGPPMLHSYALVVLWMHDIWGTPLS
ncbi:hypothetical protein CCHR01_15650 [Colletotrichum chrysophilum]|uniref:Uncharacterized protein n=1 Tax=Colletotrichum chrysophilum TaxID=1836956 RepID=A0AAD9A7V7_9PEZI|nr:hypothetical protein CCHR01_15650 [Colletotrichum chrysophilum]